MRPRRLFLPVIMVLAGLVGTPTRAEDPPAGPDPDAPATLHDLQGALDRLVQRLEALADLAGKDPRFKEIQAYAAYTSEDFGMSRRLVDAESVLDVIADPEAPSDLRKDAFKALTSEVAKDFDPDLQEARGQHLKPRNAWCLKHVVKLLSHKDADTRSYAHRLLRNYFTTLANAPDVFGYRAYDGSRTQWRKAQAHWRKVLKR